MISLKKFLKVNIKMEEKIDVRKFSIWEEKKDVTLDWNDERSQCVSNTL